MSREAVEVVDTEAGALLEVGGLPEAAFPVEDSQGAAVAVEDRRAAEAVVVARRAWMGSGVLAPSVWTPDRGVTTGSWS